MELKVTHWHGDPVPTEAEIRAELELQDLNVYRWESDPYEQFLSHTHGYHKILYVVAGNMRVEIPTRTVNATMRPGDKLELPSGLRHGIEVDADGVVCLEAHLY